MDDASRPAARTAFAPPPFAPRLPWRTGDLQTVRNAVRRAVLRRAPSPGERLWLDLDDGTGDALAAALDHPREDRGRPLAVLIHGLTGCEDSLYMRTSAANLLAAGHPVLRLNLRGAGPSGPRCAHRYHAGRTDDLRRALAALDPALTRNGLVAMGYSLGANMLLKYLGEEGAAAPVVAAVAVSAPIDLSATAHRFHAPRNRAYLGYMMRRIKAETLRPGAAIDAPLRAAVARCRTVVAFDETFIAPVNGFAGAEDYYARSMARRFLPAIRVPTLVVHAQDDPWIPAGPYLSFDWRANPALTPLLPRRGGHVGFHGRGSRIPWHDRAAAAYFEAVLGR